MLFLLFSCGYAVLFPAIVKISHFLEKETFFVILLIVSKKRGEIHKIRVKYTVETAKIRG